MHLIDWTEDLSVNIAEIDSQHQSWIDLANTFADAVFEGKEENLLEPTLLAMIEYTGYHLNFEEDLMVEFKYDGYAEHKAEHDRLRAAVESLHNEFMTRKSFIDFRMIDVLIGWIDNHIKTVDKKYTSYLNSCGVH